MRTANRACLMNSWVHAVSADFAVNYGEWVFFDGDEFRARLAWTVARGGAGFHL